MRFQITYIIFHSALNVLSAATKDAIRMIIISYPHPMAVRSRVRVTDAHTAIANNATQSYYFTFDVLCSMCAPTPHHHVKMCYLFAFAMRVWARVSVGPLLYKNANRRLSRSQLIYFNTTRNMKVNKQYSVLARKNAVPIQTANFPTNSD